MNLVRAHAAGGVRPGDTRAELFDQALLRGLSIDSHPELRRVVLQGNNALALLAALWNPTETTLDSETEPAPEHPAISIVVDAYRQCIVSECGLPSVPGELIASYAILACVRVH